MMQTASLQRQRSKKGGPGTGAQVSETRNNVLTTTPDGSLGGTWWTKFHIHKGMHSCPRVGDNTTAVGHYEVGCYRIGNLMTSFIVLLDYEWL